MTQRKHKEDWVVSFNKDDSLEDKLKKAAHVKPSLAQLAWMEREYVAFVHYGPNTFTGVQWGNGLESRDDFAPTDLNVKQWCKACADAGMKMMLYTAKHHEGFCQWFTQSTDFSVEHGVAKVDIMRSLREGCDEYGMELGVYLSPWDMYQREEGLWWTEEYNDYFLLQLRELLTNYGEIKEVWFDGACADVEIWKKVPTYQPEKWYRLVEELQPWAVIRLYDPYCFADIVTWQEIKEGKEKLIWSGKGIRWVGNEIGKSRPDEWSVQPVFDRQIAQSQTWNDLGEEKYYENALGAIWFPVEVNTVVLNQWFWNAQTSSVRSLSDLVEVYYNSIGNNGVLLLNISPDKRGLLPADQIERLMQLRTYVDETFAENLAFGAKVTVSEKHHEGANFYQVEQLIDGKEGTCWTAESWDLECSKASLIFELTEEKEFNNVLLEEVIQEGQRVAGWSFDVWCDEGWQEVVCQKTIGYKNIKRFSNVKTNRVRLNINRSWDKPMLKGFGLYLSAELPSKVEDEHDTLLTFESVDIAGELKPGLIVQSYEGGVQSAAIVGSVFGLKPMDSGIVDTVHIRNIPQEIGYAVSYTGYLKVEKEDVYTLILESADGSVLFIGDTLVINNDEPHERRSVKRQVHLKAGIHPIRIYYTSFRHKGELSFKWARSTHDVQEIQAEFFCHRE